MGIVNLILNLAGLLLWLNWTSMRVGEPVTGTPTTLLGTLRRAEPLRMRRWYFLVALLLLLFARAELYKLFSDSIQWTPSLLLAGEAIAFRSDVLERSLSFSFLSFGVTLATFYSGLLLLAALNTRPANPDPFGRLVRLLLGPLSRLNVWLKLLLPPVGTVLLWVPVTFYLNRLGVLPPLESWTERAIQGALAGCELYLSWRYLLAAILVMYVVNCYVYLGEHPFWPYINALSAVILKPLRTLPLRSGKVDFSPLVALVIIFLAAEGLQQLLFSLTSGHR